MADYGPYRKIHRDYSCLRVVAASTIVAGLLLGTAPVAFAQVGPVLGSIPEAFAEQFPALTTSGAGARDVARDSAQTASTVQPRSGFSSPLLINWNSTSRALKCSYGLLFEGNTHSCQAA